MTDNNEQPVVTTTSVEEQRQQQHVSFVRRGNGPCFWLLTFLWLVLGGFHLFLSWFLVGFLLCCTIVGIPFGWQAIKISLFLLFPFGTSIVRKRSSVQDGTTEPLLHEQQQQPSSSCCLCVCCGRTINNCCSILLNILWIVTIGWALALQAFLTGVVLCLTIVGFPFGWQCFKLAYISFWPFGTELVTTTTEEMVETVTTTTTRTTTTSTQYARLAEEEGRPDLESGEVYEGPTVPVATAEVIPMPPPSAEIQVEAVQAEK